MERLKKDIVTTVIFIGLSLLSLQFVSWICHMAFENTCIGLEEQYLTARIREVVDGMENSIHFGKTLDNYYGIQGVMDEVCSLKPEDLKVIVLDQKGMPLYLSFEESEDPVSDLARIYEPEYQKALQAVTVGSTKVEAGTKSSFVYPIYKDQTELAGYLSVFYQPKALVNDAYDVNTQTVLMVILEIVSILLMLFLTSYSVHQKEKIAKYVPAVMIMTGMFCYIVFLFVTYRGSYNLLIKEKARQEAVSIQNTVEGLLEKGLDADQLYRVDSYIKEREETSEPIHKITLLTAREAQKDAAGNEQEQNIMLDAGSGAAYLKVEINQAYITEKISLMALTFGAVFVVCLMITYELTNMAGILTVRISKDFNQKNERQSEGISSQIRVLSFLTYTAIYTSTPYAAVLMRSWDASVFGLSKAASASLPLTVELVSVLGASAVIQKVYKKLRPDRYLYFVFPFLILGNLACMTVSSPYLLIGLRVFCGIGFAFAKYWLNDIVAAGSADEESFSLNCGKLNAGLLGGITIGSSLGGIFAQALGYQANYMFTALILVILCLWAVFTMPWKLMAQMKGEMAAPVEAAENVPQEYGSRSGILENPKMLLTLLFGCVPLNVGLMYVVAFIPSYMNQIGQSAVASSYVYLINGLAGVYLGMVMLHAARKKSVFFCASVALFLAAGGILLLLAGNHLWIIMLSAAVMGLFDGFGTPSVTSHFTALAADKSQTAGMLTVFHMTGSGVQILCPMLYNLMIQPDGSRIYLAVFGAVYLVLAGMFTVLCRPPYAKTMI